MKRLYNIYYTSRLVLIFSLLFSSQNYLYSQKDSIQQLDSLTEIEENQTFALISDTKNQNLNDSVHKLILSTKLESLSKSDKQRDVLQEKIDSIGLIQKARNTHLNEVVTEAKRKAIGIPVVFYKDTLYHIYSKLGHISPKKRVNHIQNKLEDIVGQNDFDEAAFSINEIGESYDILYKDKIIITITPRDAFWLDTSAKEAAENLKAKLSIELPKVKAENNPLTNLIRIGLLIAVLIVFLIAIKYINKGIKYGNQKIITKYKHHLKGIKLKNYEFLSQQKELQIIRFLFKTLRWILIVTVINIALPTILSIFPATKGVSDKLISFILTPLKNVVYGFIDFIPSLFAIMIIVFITRYVVRFLRFLSVEVDKEKLKIPGFFPEWSKPTFNLLKIIIYAFSFVVIFPYLPGSDSPVFKGVSVFFGLLISLGSSSAIGNIIAGLVITYMRAFKIGDRVKIAGTIGDVIEKTMLVTRVRTPKNEEVSIPNAAILNGSTINYSSTSEDLGLGLVLHTTVTIGYDVPWVKVHEVLLAAATKTALIDDSPKPFVLQTSLDDFYVSYQLNAYTKHPKSSPKIYSELHANIQDCFNEAGVEILSPHYRAGRDGNSTTIPQEYLDKDYKAPSFNINVTKQK